MPRAKDDRRVTWTHLPQRMKSPDIPGRFTPAFGEVRGQRRLGRPRGDRVQHRPRRRGRSRSGHSKVGHPAHQDHQGPHPYRLHRPTTRAASADPLALGPELAAPAHRGDRPTAHRNELTTKPRSGRDQGPRSGRAGQTGGHLLPTEPPPSFDTTGGIHKVTDGGSGFRPRSEDVPSSVEPGTTSPLPASRSNSVRHVDSLTHQYMGYILAGHGACVVCSRWCAR